jgi:hypothetical protein
MINKHTTISILNGIYHLDEGMYTPIDLLSSNEFYGYIRCSGTTKIDYYGTFGELGYPPQEGLCPKCFNLADRMQIEVLKVERRRAEDTAVNRMNWMLTIVSIFTISYWVSLIL